MPLETRKDSWGHPVSPPTINKCHCLNPGSQEKACLCQCPAQQVQQFLGTWEPPELTESANPGSLAAEVPPSGSISLRSLPDIY
jgi:hypothetical protein